MVLFLGGQSSQKPKVEAKSGKANSLVPNLHGDRVGKGGTGEAHTVNATTG